MGETPSGWASTMTVMLLTAGVQFLILGVLGEYVGRAFLSANGKPQGVVREARGPAAREARGPAAREAHGPAAREARGPAAREASGPAMREAPPGRAASVQGGGAAGSPGA
jgi:hypothetical protein